MEKRCPTLVQVLSDTRETAEHKKRMNNAINKNNISEIFAVTKPVKKIISGFFILNSSDKMLGGGY